MSRERQIYPDDWRTLGLVSAEEMAEDAAELARGEDPHPEHYRWRRFVKFVQGRATVDAALAKSLYALGARDVDPALGESMLSVILRRDDCPEELHEQALRHPAAHLRRIAAARLGGKNGQTAVGPARPALARK